MRNSSVFLSNCTIWVEGITDRRYFRRYLNLFSKTLGEGTRDFKEDLHYSFVEYGGSNITHWSFLDNNIDGINVEHLCGRLFLICDRDSGKGAKQERHMKLQARLKERFCQLPCREVENLLTPKVLKSVIVEYEGAAVQLNEFRQEDYATEPLGTFIESRVLKGPALRSYKTDSGTLTSKVDFCERAMKYLNAHEDMSAEALKIAARLHTFIKQNND